MSEKTYVTSNGDIITVRSNEVRLQLSDGTEYLAVIGPIGAIAGKKREKVEEFKKKVNAPWTRRK